MKKSDINPMPEYYDRYINLNGDVELSEAFDESLEKLKNFDIERLERLDGRTYAPDKWTVKAIIQHLIDFERILSYRALLFARKDPNRRQSIDENLIAVTAKAERRDAEELIAELKAVRGATKYLFSSFDDEMLKSVGINWKSEISVLGLGFAIVGHQIHHFKVIEEKYFPLIEKSSGAF
jgi:DinB superfamily